MRAVRYPLRWALPVGLVLAALGLVLWQTRAPRYGGQPLPFWLAALTSADYRERHRAEAALRTMGPEAVPALARALRARDEGWLGRLRNLSDRFLPPRKPRVRAARIRERAALLLGTLGEAALPAVPGLIERLDDADRDAAAAAQSTLRRLGPGGVPHLITGLRHPRPSIRTGAALLLSCRQEFGTALACAVPGLKLALDDPAPTVRAQAAASLGKLGVSTPACLAALAARLKDPILEVRAAAAAALGEVGPAARPTLPLLERCLDSDETLLRIEAAQAVWRIGRQTNLVLGPLISALNNPDLRWRAALALGEMGPRAEAAIPALLEALEVEPAHRPARTPPSAAVALARMGPRAVPGLVALLDHDRPAVRVSAAFALGRQGAPARAAVPRLLVMLDDPDPEVRIVASNALGGIGGAARVTVPRLARLLDSPDEYVRAAAQTALDSITLAAAQEAAPGR